jgi:hypothetical protein
MRQRLIGFARIVWMEFEAIGILPARIGRCLVVDWLQSIEDQFLQFSAGAGLGTREKMVRRPSASPAASIWGIWNEKG